jgi:hypothetical protein
MQMYDQNTLVKLASDLNQIAVNHVDQLVKEAAYGVGGQQVQPSTPYQNAAGLYDPNPAMAGYSALSQARSDINASTILDGQVSGTNLLPYRNVLNEGYQTIASAMNPPMGFAGGGMAKAASDQEHFQKMASSGLFDANVGLPDQEGWGLINDNAMQKAASATEAIIMDMINGGALQQVRPDFVEIFLSE